MAKSNQVVLAAVLLVLAIAGGCKGRNEASDQQAVRAGIDRHLSGSGMNLDAMSQTVKKVSITGDQALADVDFRIKNGDQNMGMVVEYVLERKNGRWDVVKTQPVGGHGPEQAPSPDNK